MKLIKPSFEILEETGSKLVEKAGRTCYKSEAKITEHSHIDFTNMLLEKGHLAMIEFWTIYLIVPNQFKFKNLKIYEKNHWSKVVEGETYLAITTNMRVIIENKLEDDLIFETEPTPQHELRYSAKIICDRGVTHEIVRHRPFSYAQESTRYCNYGKTGDVTFIIPNWTEIEPCEIMPIPLNAYEDPQMVDPNLLGVLSNVSFPSRIWAAQMLDAEHSYMRLLNEGWSPQQARSVLPNSTKTEICMCGFAENWSHFFSLRTALTAHPQMQQVAIPMQEEFKLRWSNKKW